MRLNSHKKSWDELGKVDPCWAIISDPARKFGKWNIEDFFKSGEIEICNLMNQCKQLGYPRERKRALDFGCGVGRLTRALSHRFDTVDGVDISESMITKACELNREFKRCRFHINNSDHLDCFPDAAFDLIYSNHVLQHTPSRKVICCYVAEFIRLLSPGGLLVFQLPSYMPLRRRIQPRRRLYQFLRAFGFDPGFLHNTLSLYPIRMHFIPEKEIVTTLKQAHLSVVHIHKDRNPDDEVENRIYFATRV